jgi:hypothetical protein
MDGASRREAGFGALGVSPSRLMAMFCSASNGENKRIDAVQYCSYILFLPYISLLASCRFSHHHNSAPMARRVVVVATAAVARRRNCSFHFRIDCSLMMVSRPMHFICTTVSVQQPDQFISLVGIFSRANMYAIRRYVHLWERYSAWSGSNRCLSVLFTISASFPASFIAF